MIFNTIEDIISFRYEPVRYMNRSFWKYPDKFDTSKLKNFPKTFFHYDTVVWSDILLKFKVNNDIKNILCRIDNTCIERLIKMIDDMPYVKTITFTGADRPNLSDIIHKLKIFKKLNIDIFYEAKDIECDWVKSIPMGMIVAYMYRNGEDNILDIFNNSTTKTSLIGSAFGSIWRRHTHNIQDRKELLRFSRESKLINIFTCSPTDYIKMLSTYNFFACPLGTGIQTPKICECILTETVPVVTSHPVYNYLKKLELPVIIVDKWSDLTRDILLEYNEKNDIDWVKCKNTYHVNNLYKIYKKL